LRSTAAGTCDHGSGNDRVIKLSPAAPRAGNPLHREGTRQALEIAIDFAAIAPGSPIPGRAVHDASGPMVQRAGPSWALVWRARGIAVTATANILRVEQQEAALSVLSGRVRSTAAGIAYRHAISPSFRLYEQWGDGVEAVAIDIAGNVLGAGAEGVVEYIGMARGPLRHRLSDCPKVTGSAGGWLRKGATACHHTENTPSVSTEQCVFSSIRTVVSDSTLSSCPALKSC
jgi:hypothetical protein